MGHAAKDTEIRSLTGLRWLAATLVFLSHAAGHEPLTGSWTDAPLLLGRVGWSGVPIFFTLSGFLLCYLYYPRFSGGLDGAALRAYCVKRFARIYPLYYVVLAIAAANLAWNPRYAGTARPGWADFGAHLVMLHAWFGDFAASYIPAAWSLSVEEAFYLLLPFLCLALARFAPQGFAATPPWRFVLGLTVLTAAVVGVGFLIDGLLPEKRPFGFLVGWVNLTVVGQMPTFALGMLAGLVARRYEGRALFTNRLWSNLLGGAALALYGFGGWLFGRRDGSWMEGFTGQAVFAISAMFFVLSLCGRSVFATVLAWGPFVYGGRVSYAFYLVAGQAAFRIFLAKFGLTQIWHYYLGYLAISAALYHGVERPCHLWLRRRPAARAEKEAAPLDPTASGA